MTDPAKETLWKVIAVGCLTMMLGAGGEWFFRGRDTITKDDLTIALTPMQKQLDDLASQNGESKAEIVQLEISVGRISEHLGVSAAKP